jgi:hypothetical protein
MITHKARLGEVFVSKGFHPESNGLHAIVVVVTIAVAFGAVLAVAGAMYLVLWLFR